MTRQKHREIISLSKDFISQYIYHSNAYEGDALTVEQTEAILNGETIADKTVREHLEVLNHAQAVALSFHCAEEKELTETHLKDIYSLLTGSIGTQQGYRKKNIYLPNLRWTPLNYPIIPQAVPDFLVWFNNNWNTIDVFTLVDLQVRFLNIAPFAEGNEKLARLLVNVILWHNHHNGIIFHHGESKRYYLYMNLAREGNAEHMIQLMEKFMKLCTQKHDCGEDMLLPLVNSPRASMCGYTGND